MQTATSKTIIRRCHHSDLGTMLGIINAAAIAYRGAIPDDSWHEPYMSAQQLRYDVASGVEFVGCEIDGALAGVMGMQYVRNVKLIRHAYVLPAYQGHGVGSALIGHLTARSQRQMLVGTWRAATWAIRFYERHAFRLVPPTITASLLETYWAVPEPQIDASVVLAAPALTAEEGQRLLSNASR